MVQLDTQYLWLKLRSPLIASASPLTGSIDGLRQLEDAGAAAVVLPSLFEEQLIEEARVLERAGSLPPGALTGQPAAEDRLAGYNTGPEGYLTLVAKAKAALSIPVIASINAFSTGSWLDYVALLEEAGADAIELNPYAVAADPLLDGRAVERRHLELVRVLKQVTGVPLAVKLSPFFSALANLAVQLADGGVDGLVLFNRFYQPDIDVERLEVTPTLTLSSPEDLRLPLRWVGILRGALPHVSLAATGGVHSAQDAAKALLAGADVVMLASALLRHGPEHLARVEAGLRGWLAEHGYGSVAEARGRLSHPAAPDRAAYERANYIWTLVSAGQRFTA